MRRTDIDYGRGWLDKPAAASLRRVDATLGHNLQVTEAGRTWAQQNAHWLTFQRDGYPIALHPDTPSIHQLGNAIDTDERNLPVLNDHGWFQTVYRNGVLVEPWHFEYDPTRDNHLNDNTPEDETMIINIKGKRGKRRGGLYYVSGGKATFIGYRRKSAFPLFTSEKEIATLQSRIDGLK